MTDSDDDDGDDDDDDDNDDDDDELTWNLFAASRPLTVKLSSPVDVST